MRSLATLLTPRESVWLIEPDPPAIPELTRTGTLHCLQMALPRTTPPPAITTQPTPLTAADAADMHALITIAFPGYYRPRTREMGDYHGIRAADGTLAAMGGERLMLPGYSEISGVCTHPTHRGHGYASSIMGHLIRDHRTQDRLSWLHVLTTNHHPIALYQHMGFETIRTVTLHRYALAT
jgi:predicted GNAT family acetyltransferase